MYDPNKERRKKPTVGSIIGVIIALAMFSPELMAVVIVVGMFALTGYILFRIVAANKGRQRKPKDTFDECPKPICFHKDRGEHHVRKGREIDPWDRPDIDIRKYQRK